MSKSFSELVDEYCQRENLYNFDGDSGLGRFEKLLGELGYKSTGFRYGTVIESFLSDNPGVMQAIMSWLMDSEVEEWREALEVEEEPEEWEWKHGLSKIPSNLMVAAYFSNILQ